MKCVGLLALLILIQSVSKFKQFNHRKVDVEEIYHEIDNNEKSDDETPSTVNVGGTGITSETQNVSPSETQNVSPSETQNVSPSETQNVSPSETQNVSPSDDTSETFNNQPEHGQDEKFNVTSEPHEQLQSSDGIFDSTKFYNQHRTETFPRLCMDGLTGSMIDIVGNYISSFSSLHRTLSGLSKYQSSTLSTASTALFNIVDSMAKITGSTSSVLLLLWERLPEAFNSITEVVSGLEIQAVGAQLLDTITDLQNLLTGAIQIVIDVEELKFGIEKKLNNVSLLIAKSVQAMVNNLKVIADTTTKAIESVSSEVQEAIISHSLVLATSLVIVQSVFASITCVLSPLQHITSTALNAILLYIGSTLNSIIIAIKSTGDLETENMSVVLGSISATIAYAADDVNWSSESIIQTILELDISYSLGDLLDGSSEVLGNISNSTAHSIASLASSLNMISSASFDMLTKVTDQIKLVHKGLSKVIGNDSIILTILTRSLPSIFRAIASALNELGPGIGAEAPEALNKYTGNVQLSLKNLLSLFSGSVEGNLNIAEIVREIGKSVQQVASAVISITLAISGAVDNVHAIVVESVLSLQVIFSAVLYITQWVLAIAVSVFNSVAESVDEILLKLTILISESLAKLSLICSTIPVVHSDGLQSTLVKIVPFVQDMKQSITLSYTPISNNVFNIMFNIDKLLIAAPKPTEMPTVELRPDTSGTIPELLSSVTGKLISISPELSSTRFSLNNSLKTCSNSSSAALNVICNILTLVLTRFSTLSGTASDVLSLISDLLGETFNPLSDVVSKFNVLGDVSVSLKTSVTNIHSSLLSLIDAIEDSTDSNILVDPIRNVAKNTQILLSTFSAIFEALSRANKDISDNLSEVITNLPYIVSTIVVVVQYVLGAAIAKVLVTFGSVPPHLQELALTLSTILQRITSITANITLAQSGTDVNYSEIINMILSPVSELNVLSSSSLSVISQILANIKVNFDSAHFTVLLGYLLLGRVKSLQLEPKARIVFHTSKLQIFQQDSAVFYRYY